MVNRPKRKISKDNPYTLMIIDNKYTVIFKDSKGNKQIVEIDEQVFYAMDKFELEDISQMHRTDRHIERSELLDETLYCRATNKPDSIEDEVIQKTSFEDLKNAINTLPEIQKRRIRKYYFDDISMVDIAKEENCSKVAVKYSLECAINNLKEILKK